MPRGTVDRTVKTDTDFADGKLNVLGTASQRRTVSTGCYEEANGSIRQFVRSLDALA